MSRSKSLKKVAKAHLGALKISLWDSKQRNQDKVIEQLKKEKNAMEIQKDYFAKECVKLQEEVVRLEKTVFKLKNQLEDIGYVSNADRPGSYMYIESSNKSSRISSSLHPAKSMSMILNPPQPTRKILIILPSKPIAFQNQHSKTSLAHPYFLL